MEFYKYLMGLISKGFATTSEKQALKMMFKSLEEDKQEEVADEVDEALGLPEDAEASEEAGSDAEASDESSEEDADESEDEALEKNINALVTKTLDKAVEDVKNEGMKQVKTFLKKQAELKEKKSGLHNKEVKKSREQINKEVSSFLQAVMKNDVVALTKDLSTGTDALGGYLLQNEFVAEIQHLVTEYGVARREMTTFNMSTKTLDLNNLASDPSVSWEDELASTSSTQFQVGRVSLTPKKLKAIVPMSEELFEDSEIDIASFLASRIAEKLAQAEDEAFFKGDGTPTYGSFTGVLNASGVNTVTMSQTGFSNVDADDLLNMQDSTPQGAHANGKYYLHRSVFNLVRKLKDSQNNYIYQRPADGQPATIWDKPYVLVEAMPAKGDTAANTPFIIFGDMKKGAYLGIRKDMTVQRSTEATILSTDGVTNINLFQQDAIAMKFLERVGYALVVPTALTVLKTAASSI